MYKSLFNHLLKRNIPYQRQLGFRQGHSTEYVIMQLIHQVNDNFENKYTGPYYVCRSY